MRPRHSLLVEKRDENSGVWNFEYSCPCQLRPDQEPPVSLVLLTVACVHGRESRGPEDMFPQTWVKPGKRLKIHTKIENFFIYPTPELDHWPAICFAPLLAWQLGEFNSRNIKVSWSTQGVKLTPHDKFANFSITTAISYVYVCEIL